MYVGTRADNVAEACEIIGRELVALRDEGVGDEELARAKEHVKGRMVLGLESTGARMSRLARAILFDVPLLSLDEMLGAGRRGRRRRASPSSPRELYDPAGLAAACVGPDEELLPQAPPARSVGALVAWSLRVIRVVVSGAAGRMGETVCEAVEGADDMELAGRADPGARHELARAARRRRRRRRLHDPRDGARERRAPASSAGRPRRRRHDRLRPRRAARRGSSATAPATRERASSPRTSRSARC